MTDILPPPVNRPSSEQMKNWADWTEREMLVAQLVRINAVAGIMMQVANDVPQIMKQPMVKMAMRMFVRPDKSNEQSAT